MTTLIAALPMYDWPEVRAEADGIWGRLRDRLRADGIDAPEHLARRNADLPPVPGGIRDRDGRMVAPDPASLPPDEFDLPALWCHPSLLLAQTCWGPMELGLADQAAVVGQGDYSAFEGGEGESYSSALLMRESLPCPSWGGSIGEAERGGGDFGSVATPTPPLRADPHEGEGKGWRLAFNSSDSMSGLIALERDLEAKGASLAVFSELVETGSHRASIVAVAQGRADLCAVDCRTWDLAKRFEPRAAELVVVGWTAKRLGLPFITSRHTDPTTARILRGVMISSASSRRPDRTAAPS